MSVMTVYTPQCPTKSDGRLMHFFRKVNGVFVCTNCGARDSGTASR